MAPLLFHLPMERSSALHSTEMVFVPSRYCVTTDDRVIMASETGVLPIDPTIIKEKGRLQPGKMFVVDMEQGTHHQR